jgi:rhamnogalacturonan endolyase
MDSSWKRHFCLMYALPIAIALGAGSASAAITIDTTNASDWKISNGVLSLDWLPGDGRIFSIHWSAFPDQELIDQTNRNSKGPKGFYMDNVGPGFSTPSNDYYLDPNGNYIDWWVKWPASSSNAFTWSQHCILFANDPSIHVYFVLDHGPGNIAGSIGQIQWVFRGDLTQFTNTYSVNTGLNNLGATTVPMPDAVLFGTGLVSGRNVQDATSDLHGLALPQGFRRQFYTKYDYSSYEYLHQAEGVYGSTLGAWMVLPSRESLTGGPTKQDLIFTGNLLIMEAYSNHLDNQISFPVPQDAVMHRLYGPFYLHFNAPGGDPMAASLYQEALSSAEQLTPAYDSETELLNNGYVPSSGRGEVHASIEGTKGLDLNQAWAVLSDENTNFQYAHAGREYWVNVNPGGIANFHNVAPGTYRLSVYVLGEWGELRQDNISVGANQTTHTLVTFRRENFGPVAPIWTLGTADRSSHEFLHGQIANPVDLDPNYADRYTARLGNSVQDDREYWGNWNYWADFANNNGAVIYYATPVGSTPASNDLTKWNYNQWHIFSPGLYAGVFNPADTSTDGYNYLCPSYVGPFGACRTATVPDWQVHFTTTANQQAQGQYVLLSVGLAAAESSLTVSLNGNPIVWPGFNVKNADADVRSGFSGTYQWVVFQWNTSQLNPPGADNVITFNVNRTQGVMYDALRMEITNTSAAHEVTGWNDYGFLNSSSYEPANDSVSNNN